MLKEILVEVSARHCHLSQQNLEKLFGKGHELTKIKQLTQPSDFAAKEMVQIYTKEGIMNLRVVGPVRKETQVELSLTDELKLGIRPVVRQSGDLKRTPGALLIGPKGRLKIKRGVIVALRHLHCSVKEAKENNLRDGQNVCVKIKGDRALIFDNVKVRVRSDYALCLHIDTDEGNAAGIDKKATGYLI